MFAGLLALWAFVVLPAMVQAQAPPYVPWSGPIPVVTPLQPLSGEAVAPGGVAGRVTLVHFFATWCAPCKEELAALDELAKAMAGRPFTILGVDVGEPEIRVRRFFETSPVTFPVLLDTNREAMKAWAVASFPTSFLIGADGAGMWKIEGDVAWQAASVIARIEVILGAAKTGKGRP